MYFGVGVSLSVSSVWYSAEVFREYPLTGTSREVQSIMKWVKMEWVNVVASVIPHPVNQIVIVPLVKSVTPTMGHDVVSVIMKTHATHQGLEVSILLDPIMDHDNMCGRCCEVNHSSAPYRDNDDGINDTNGTA
jgi:hypothetical protein